MLGTIPFEFVITLVMAALAVFVKRDMLCFTLLGAWLFSVGYAQIAPMEWLPGGAVIVDVVIAVIAIQLWTDHDSQRARIVGLLSLAKLCFHFGISFHFGQGDWFAYALSVNTLFVFQCLTAGGLIYGLDSFLNHFSPRHRGHHPAVHQKDHH